MGRQALQVAVQVLLDAGATPSGVVTSIAGLTLIIGVIAAAALKFHVPAPWFTAAFALMWLGYFVLTRRRDRSVETFARLLSLADAA